MLYSTYDSSGHLLHAFVENYCCTLAELLWILLVFPTALHFGHLALEEVQ